MYVFDTSEDAETLGEIRHKFYQKFGQTNQPLLSHLFGFYRLVPLMLFIKDYEGSGTFKEFKEDSPDKIKEKINDIRCALAHNDISVDETGFTFENRLKKSDNKSLHLSFESFEIFVWEVENNYISERKNKKVKTL